ncbi:MAG: hypothetical protein KTR24_16345 [Saprospiraceae bacterium]|nr:hypothetical protein [Saprospiraceae bacterium]
MKIVKSISLLFLPLIMTISMAHAQDGWREVLCNENLVEWDPFTRPIKDMEILSRDLLPNATFKSDASGKVLLISMHEEGIRVPVPSKVWRKARQNGGHLVIIEGGAWRRGVASTLKALRKIEIGGKPDLALAPGTCYLLPTPKGLYFKVQEDVVYTQVDRSSSLYVKVKK